MNRRQRKHIEIYAVIGALMVIVSLLENHELLARVPFIFVGLYFLLNWHDIREIEAIGPTPQEVLEGSKPIRVITLAILALEIVAAYYLVFTGSHVASDHVMFLGLVLAFLGPLLPAIVISRILLHARLGSQDA